MKLTPTLGGEYSGSLGGLTASRNRGGAYLRRRSIPTNPDTENQTTVRSAFGGLSQRWVNTLSQIQRTAWNTYGQNVDWIDSLGQTIKLSGINHYVRSNTPAVQATNLADDYTNITAIATNDAAPTIFDLGTAPNVLTVGADTTGGVCIVTPELTPQASTDQILFSLSPPVNPSINFFKGPFLFVANYAGDTAGGVFTIDVGTAAESPYWATYGIPAAGSSLFLKIRSRATDGRMTSPVIVGPITVETTI